MEFPAFLRLVATALIVGTLAACSTAPPGVPPAVQPPPVLPAPATPPPLPGTGPVSTLNQPGSRWVPVGWDELPGFGDDALHEAWNAWVRSCERPPPAFARLCPEVRRLSIGTQQEQRTWMLAASTR